MEESKKTVLKASKKKSAFAVRDVAFIALCVALISVCSFITFPAPVPFTLQTFGVFFALFFLGGKRGTVAVTCYVLLGAFGAPIFSGFKGGIGALAGATGGYIAGFFLLAVSFWAATKIFGEKNSVKVIAAVAGLILLYVFGTLWFVFVTSKTQTVTVKYALFACVLPFVPFDAVKLIFAYITGNRLKKRFPTVS